jgi:hypothetical protein
MQQINRQRGIGSRKTEAEPGNWGIRGED